MELSIVTNIITVAILAIVFFKTRQSLKNIKENLSLDQSELKPYKVASTSELENLFRSIKADSIKRDLLAHIAEKGLTNTEYDFLMEILMLFAVEDMGEGLEELAITVQGEGWLGVHECICGARSGSHDLVLPDGTITNSLLVHYVECHRDEIPRSELAKLLIAHREFCEDIKGL